MNLWKFSGLQTYDIALNSPCSLSKTNESGIYTRYNECVTKRKIRQFNICSFEGRAPMVCCRKPLTHLNLRSANTIRISMQGEFEDLLTPLIHRYLEMGLGEGDMVTSLIDHICLNNYQLIKFSKNVPLPILPIGTTLTLTGL